MFEACQASRNRSFYPIVVVALSTGARMGEILNLRWPNVDLRRGTLTFQETKNGERRSVPLAGQALTLMQPHARVRHVNTRALYRLGQRTALSHPAWAQPAVSSPVEKVAHLGWYTLGSG